MLSAHGVVAAYPGAAPVLDGADLTVTAGRRLALLGANGSGKTTLLRCLSGAHRPAAGSVVFNGEPLRHNRSALNQHRQRVQLVLQDPDDQLFSAQVHQDVSFGPMNLRLDPAEVERRVAESLAQLGISHLADDGVHRLSFGQRKRVAIAGALAMRPAVLLLDEPTAGLDPAGVRDMLAALAALEAAGTTVVMSTHDVALAWEWADEVAVVNEGRVVQGDMREMLTDDALMKRARLERPWQAEMLKTCRVHVSAGDLPRTPRAVAELVCRLNDPPPTHSQNDSCRSTEPN